MAVAVADDWQGKGVGGRPLRRLQDIAGQNGVGHFEATVLPHNRRTLVLARELGFTRLTGQHDVRDRRVGQGRRRRQRRVSRLCAKGIALVVIPEYSQEKTKVPGSIHSRRSARRAPSGRVPPYIEVPGQRDTAQQ
ncbi:MAG: GNAT family N-acetyltransferase [Thiogranum sp.]|nr:GNAT family N-acetyltransferase [Thiogranum sp.]